MVAAPGGAPESSQNTERKCGEASFDVSFTTCSENYDHISNMAAKCCSGGASYCPPPQLCADPASFNPGAAVEYQCVGMITADFTKDQCSAAGCYPSDHDGKSYCSCGVTDSEDCKAKLAGELLGVCVCRRLLKRQLSDGELTDNTTWLWQLLS